MAWSSKKVNKAGTLTLTDIKTVAGTTKDLYVNVKSWPGHKSSILNHLDNIEFVWTYQDKNHSDGKWLPGTTDNQSKAHGTDWTSSYTFPDSASKVRVTAHLVSKTHTVKTGKNSEKTIKWFTSGWSSYKYKSISTTIPSAPSVDLTYDAATHQITATATATDDLSKSAYFALFMDGKSAGGSGGNWIPFNDTEKAIWKCSVKAYHKYEVKAKAKSSKGYQSDYSTVSSTAETVPIAPTNIKVVSLSSTSVNAIIVDDNANSGATKYEVYYTTKLSNFTNNESAVSSTPTTEKHVAITDLSTGTYYFRVKAENSIGTSDYCNVTANVTLGKKPAAPTTWSYPTVADTTDTVRFYWTHNPQDSSRETWAQIQLYFNGELVKNDVYHNQDPEDETTQHYADYDMGDFETGGDVQWRVRTQGAITDGGNPDDPDDNNYWSPWSTVRTISIFGPPTLSMTTNLSDGEDNPEMIAYPLILNFATGPEEQTCTGLYLTIKSNASYQTFDDEGNIEVMPENTVVYSHLIVPGDSHEFPLTINPGEMDLGNNQDFTITALSSMSSGKTITETVIFTTAFEESQVYPDAHISDIDTTDYTAIISPYAYTDNEEEGTLATDVVMNVYRKNYDGTFTLIGENIENTGTRYIVDPHPNLNSLDYRIAAVNMTTGNIDFADVSADSNLEGPEKCIVIQWDEVYTTYDFESEDATETLDEGYGGSILLLPYDIDVSSSYSMDTSLVEYIGREHPVSYYGTQKGETASWSTNILMDDEDTLAMLRKLAIYDGDCYVREPSGTGYFAHINVSFSLTHAELLIPVSLEITRVEGEETVTIG